MDSINLKIKASSQIALLGTITINLRAINVLQEGKKILVNFYCEKIGDEEEEIPEIFATEMIAYFEDMMLKLAQSFCRYLKISLGKVSEFFVEKNEDDIQGIIFYILLIQIFHKILRTEVLVGFPKKG